MARKEQKIWSEVSKVLVAKSTIAQTVCLLEEKPTYTINAYNVGIFERLTPSGHHGISETPPFKRVPKFAAELIANTKQ